MSIYTILRGGIGNQMFQYALGRHIADKLDTQLYLEKSYYTEAKHCQFRLDKFNIREDQIISEHQTSYQLLKETSMDFNPHVLNLTGNLALYGYWQNSNYFKDIRSSLLKDFTPKDSCRIAIPEGNSVAVHIRGGDYRGWHKFDVVSPNYYKEAFRLIAEKVENPRFYIFTNDDEYALKMLAEVAGHYEIMRLQGEEWEEMNLMSRCNHHIIANSSFSWWSSYLCNNPDKIIISPSKWFNEEPSNKDHLEIDLYTSDMILIEP